MRIVDTSILALRLLGIFIVVQAIGEQIARFWYPEMLVSLALRVALGVLIIAASGTWGRKIAATTPSLQNDKRSGALIPAAFFIVGLLTVVAALMDLRRVGSVAAIEYQMGFPGMWLATIAPAVLKLFVGNLLMVDCHRFASRFAGADDDTGTNEAENAT